MRAELRRALPDLRCLSQPGEAQAGVGIAHPEVLVLVSVLDASGVWIFKRADANVVPFSVQVCVNGREWLARQMDRVGMKYVRQDNCFPWIIIGRRIRASGPST